MNENLYLRPINVEVTYNAFNKVENVTKSSAKLTITYGPDRQRVKTYFSTSGTTQTTLYADNYEQRTKNGTTTTYHYVASPDGLAAVYIKSGSTATAYYIETDHLGSIVRAYDYVGNTKFSATYDAWGNQTISTNAIINLTRGFPIAIGSGHEHWNIFGFTDMNFAIKRTQREYGKVYSTLPSVSKMGEANYCRFYTPKQPASNERLMSTIDSIISHTQLQRFHPRS